MKIICPGSSSDFCGRQNVVPPMNAKRGCRYYDEDDEEECNFDDCGPFCPCDEDDCDCVCAFDDD